MIWQWHFESLTHEARLPLTLVKGQNELAGCVVPQGFLWEKEEFYVVVDIEEAAEHGSLT